ncbi:hypothetical protein NE237_029748 [Protea cynaroides]|uniref:Uncharacterized protein n=1 Tax=Protea cynaroides TaxID=273540 RepID=A0A9Q0GTR2_9MAGN|nr:hypothetical protein NE237_029748 [Protea cynaroides]
MVDDILAKIQEASLFDTHLVLEMPDRPRATPTGNSMYRQNVVGVVCRLLPNEGLSKLTPLKNLHLVFEDETDHQILTPNLNSLYVCDFESLSKESRNLYSLQHLKFGPFCEVCYSLKELPANVRVSRD